MSVLNNSIVPASAAAGYDIDNSCRFNDNDSAYLSRTPSSAGNRQKWTWSGWCKFTEEQGGTQPIFSAGIGSNYTRITLISAGNLLSVMHYDGTWAMSVKSSNYIRDFSSWYHICVAVDTTQATASDRVKMWINGVQVSSFADTTYPSRYYSTAVSNTVAHYVAKDPDDVCDMYQAEVHFIDGQALDHTSFGETDATYGHWKPKEVTGMTYGTNGFYLDFANKSTKHAIIANGDVNHSTTQSKVGGSSIAFDGTGDVLTIPTTTDFNFGEEFTYEAWVYHNNTSGEQFYFRNSNMNLRLKSGVIQFSSGNGTIITTFSPSSSTWYHLALVGTNSNTTKLYIDGTLKDSQTASFFGITNPSLRIGDEVGANYLNGYMDEIRVSNTARYTSGFTPSTTAFTEDSNTLLLIHSDTTNGSTTFTDSSGVEAGLGTDQSGQDNDWASNNLAATDQMLDTPTNNFCTLNPLRNDGGYTLSQGNLRQYIGAAWKKIPGSLANSTGKWYWEVIWESGTDCLIGTMATIDDNHNYPGGLSGDLGYSYSKAGHLMHQGGQTSSWGASYTTGDVIGVALDMDNLTLKFYKNNSLQGTITSIPAGTIGPATSTYNGYAVSNFGQDATFAGNKSPSTTYTDGTYGSFYYEPPSGFKALCTANLDDPAEGLWSDGKNVNFNTVTYTGTENASIHGAETGVGFQPDMIWFKNRNFSYNNAIFDVIRGTNSYLVTNSTGTEVNPPTGKDLTSFDSDGFSIGTSWGAVVGGKEGSTFRTYVAWCWKANGSGTSISVDDYGSGVPSIASTVSANTTAGFSIVSYTGNSNAGSTVGHGLSSQPEMIIIKKTTTAENWVVYNHTIGNTQYLYLDESTWAAGYNMWNNTTPSSSVFTLSSYAGVNASGSFIAYCFHSVDGYSKVGSYTGNGSSDGTFVYTGFRPAYVMIKCTNESGDRWTVYDTTRSEYNGTGHWLYPNESLAEGAGLPHIDAVSNGLKFRDNHGYINENGDTYIYIAFAETPFKYSNAR